MRSFTKKPSALFKRSSGWLWMFFIEFFIGGVSLLSVSALCVRVSVRVCAAVFLCWGAVCVCGGGLCVWCCVCVCVLGQFPLPLLPVRLYCPSQIPKLPFTSKAVFTILNKIHNCP